MINILKPGDKVEIHQGDSVEKATFQAFGTTMSYHNNLCTSSSSAIVLKESAVLANVPIECIKVIAVC